MVWTPETAYAELRARSAALLELDSKINEAETRLKLINHLIFDVLGWPESKVEVEKYCREVGFSDYVFTQSGAAVLVLEAKKAGVTFTVPSAKFGRDPVPFALLAKESPSARSSLIQAIGYAVILGARYVAISNGKQWLFTLTFVENQSVDERLIYAFDSIGAIDANFRQFWNCFSPEGLNSNAAHERLFESRKLPPPPKLSREISGYPTRSRRNIYVNELAYVLQLLWDAIAREEKSKQFITDCYVGTQADEQLIAYAESLLATRHRGDSTYFQSTVEDAENVGKTAIVSGDKPFVILGEVGHGKSTFLEYLRYTAAAKTLTGYVQIDINFLDRPDKATEVTDYIYREVEAQILSALNIDILANNIVRGALYKEFKRFKDSARYKVLEGDEGAQRREELNFVKEHIIGKHTYFASLFRYLKKGQKKSVVIFFDNLDRRSADIQEEAFLKASAIARDWECAVFVCLRPTTFFTSIKSGVLDALAPKTFTVGAPDLRLVLKRRFEFARRIALGEACQETAGLALQDLSTSVNLPSVADIFACCEFSARKGASAIDMLSALSNGNIRLLIDLTRRILTSGHLDTRKIARAIGESGSYTVPDFEAAKTLLFGDYDQYDANTSIFVNLFDTFHSDPKEHFLRILLLDYLDRADTSRDTIGYVEEQDLIGYSNTYYFDSITFRKHLMILTAAGCINIEDDIPSKRRYRITTRGRYHIGGLVRTFQYLDAMIIDTPILDNEVRIKFEFTEDIIGRITRTRLFLAYLKSSAAHLHDVQGEHRLIRIFADAENDIAAVEARLVNR